MQKTDRAGNFARAWINSKLTPLVIAASVLLGAFAVWKLPREEEPQIIVPMVDVFVQMPGASSKEVEERVTKPMEQLLWEIPGVEYIYSTSSPGYSTAIVRFLVGQDEEKAIVRLNQKLAANMDLIPPGASPPLVKPRSIDDVPILALTLWSKRYGDYELRRVAAKIAKKRGLKVVWLQTQDDGAVECSPRLTGLLERSVKRVQGRSLSLASGAGHDGVVMSALTPVAMLFVRCRDGLSHHPDEYASPRDLALALQVMIDFLENFSLKKH